MNRKQHVQVTEIFFGYGYDKVHEWIDELFPKYFGFEHWKERHHLEALKEKYGEGTTEYWVGVFHIICDWFSHCRLVYIPENKEETVKILRELMLI